jgi:Zn-dependent proteases
MPFFSNIRSMMAEPISFFLSLLAVILSLSAHEFAHAFAAHKMGDDTARNNGRMTLNPLAHLDLFGFLSMMTVGLGWAKPVPVNPNNYRKRMKGEIVVSLAGVATNLILAVISIVIFALMGNIVTEEGTILSYVWDFFVTMSSMNLSLCFFNLLPIPPLDGYHVLKETVLIGRVSLDRLWKFERYGSLILAALIILPSIFNLPGLSSLLGTVVYHVWRGILSLVLSIIGLF